MRRTDAFSTLGVRPGASLREATAAYHELAKHYHPDMGGQVERFREIQTAYARIRPLLSSRTGPARIDVYA
jgi:curved DNA-binding protein CbpA